LAVTSELRRLFAKEKSVFARLAIGNWSRALYELRTEVTDLMTRPPGKIKQFTPSLGTVRTMKPPASAIGDRELAQLVAVANDLTSDEDQEEMIRIITAGQPELADGAADAPAREIVVDVMKLNPTTIQALKEFMKKALERQGKECTA
jgi:hypothetical protein